MPRESGGEKNVADTADVFADFDGIPDSELNANGLVGAAGGGRGESDGGALMENDEFLDPNAPNRGQKNNLDDNPFSFTKFLQGDVNDE